MIRLPHIFFWPILFFLWPFIIMGLLEQKLYVQGEPAPNHTAFAVISAVAFVVNIALWTMSILYAIDNFF